jgi:hypothetical protein
MNIFSTGLGVRPVNVDEVREWLHGPRLAGKATLTAVSDAFTVLQIAGPALGRLWPIGR